MASQSMSSGRRVAAFIAGVGEGNRFTKMELFNAVPGVAQADRRMRDLREMGWQIDNYKVNPNLSPDQYLLRKIGVRIDLGEKPPVTVRRTVTGPKRRRILERDGRACQICGIAAGEAFPDEPARTATLTIGHLIPRERGGSDNDGNLRAECQRCNDEARDVTTNPPDPDEVFTAARNVKGGLKTKTELYRWMLAGRREIGNVERVFLDWSRLPIEQRQVVMNKLGLEVLRRPTP
ncbi:HNH endonuclease [Nocardia gipuzkoensis]|uniref:HNH endonuclease n=1 Tax=Nocardia gipuzkoensis TaxID=2749991 RepID=UPI001E2F1E14|nr:HNH endonuclease signature motif containing protein [Nocardia gipuzkoensis]UGT66115.1 HNH endonuclease [Nocardia gipuzkoensis]